jgi:hypothetical protein
MKFMAKLINNKAIFEIMFLDYPYGYIRYGLKLSYDGKSFINPDLIAEDPIEFYEYESDSLIPFFEKILNYEENDKYKQDRYQSLEPDMSIETIFYPVRGLKETERLMSLPNPALLYLSDEYKQKLHLVDKEREKSGNNKLPDDFFDITFFINDLKLKPNRGPGSAYGAFLPALFMSVERHVLESFVKELKEEYKSYLQKHE